MKQWANLSNSLQAPLFPTQSNILATQFYSVSALSEFIYTFTFVPLKSNSLLSRKNNQRNYVQGRLPIWNTRIRQFCCLQLLIRNKYKGAAFGNHLLGAPLSRHGKRENLLKAFYRNKSLVGGSSLILWTVTMRKCCTPRYPQGEEKSEGKSHLNSRDKFEGEIVGTFMCRWYSWKNYLKENVIALSFLSPWLTVSKQKGNIILYLSLVAIKSPSID